MEVQVGSQPSERPETDPDCLFEITEEEDPNNPKEMTFFIKIVVTKEMKARMADIQKNKRDKVARIQQREKTPEMIALKQKCQTYRRLDPKSIEEERRKNGGNNEVHKSLAEYEGFQLHRQKYTFSLFDSFENRGKSHYIKFSYNSGEKHLGIRINKNYFLNELHLSRRDLFNIAISFTRTWQFDFHGMIRVLWRIYTQAQKPINYNLFIRSLDLISSTFDIIYHDKRIYRFRYSPFEFRTSPTFKDDNQLTGYYQSLSCIPDISSSNKMVVSDSQFYVTPRLFIFDDLTDSNLFYKILNRTNLVYQIFSISRGNYPNSQGSLYQIDQFAKKSLGQFYFSTTRLKKILFTWSFRHFKRQNKDKKIKEDEKEAREVILHIPFQLQRDNQPNVQPVYRMKMQILQMSKIITFAIKEDLAFRLKEWYLLVKQMLCQRDKTFFEAERQNLSRPRNERDVVRAQIQDFEMYVQFNSRDRFDKFFIGFLLLVSTVLDRHFFTLHQDKDRKRQEYKVVSLDTQQTIYFSNKKQYIHHYHCIRLIFRHTYFANMLFCYAREEEKQGLYNYLQNSRNCDYRLKCAEWKLQRVMKIKRKNNIKNKDDIFQTDQAELLTFPDDFKRYIGILVKHFPLRLIYKDILAFVEAVCKTCYSAQQEANLMSLNGYDHVLRSIVNVLLQQYYYCQFKQKQEKLKEKEKQKQKEDKSINLIFQKDQGRLRPEQKIESETAKKDKLEELFTRVLFIKLLTKGDVGFYPEDKLLFEVTFKLMEFKHIWQTRIKEGSVVMRIFEDRVQFERDYVTVHTLKGDVRNKKISDEANIRASLEACFVDPKLPNSL